ncbi:hypothetical protein MTR_0002s0930 [Medicago truncatula]|uniref:Uncharacterized protein n=1 Tax=Medicago truncatula TaxID=3880 RepID=A0A072TW36_MEDTR|nr:hypothetical protein MTR_0002s0930 [Medicago truncatula]
MRGTISKEQLQFDPEIEKTARRNNAKTKEVKRLARLAQQSGSSGSIPTTSSSIPRESPRGSPQPSPPPSPSSVDEEDIIGMEEQQQLPPPGNQEVENALPSWTNPRRLARLGGQTTRQVEMKSSTINLITNHPFSGLDHENPYQHLTTFYELAGSVGASVEEEEAVFCRLFPHSLIGKIQHTEPGSFDFSSFSTYFAQQEQRDLRQEQRYQRQEQRDHFLMDQNAALFRSHRGIYQSLYYARLYPAYQMPTFYGGGEHYGAAEDDDRTASVHGVDDMEDDAANHGS